MLGTLVNALAIVVGGALGLLIRGGLKERFKDTVNAAMGLAVIFVGVSSCLSALLEGGASSVLYIVSLALGGLAGEALNIEARLESLGNWLQNKVFSGGSNISKGFVAGSLLYCIGTMAVLGSIESGLSGNHSILFAKSVIDGIVAIIFASTLGVGVLLSAASVLVYQGTLTLLAGLVSAYITADMMREISIVGGILIFAIGTNMLGITKIRVGNLLPALLVPVLYYVISGLVLPL